jgi:hypothetical protein
MKSIIFVISLFILGCGMSTNSGHEIIIHSQTDVFIDKKTGEAIDRESFQRNFVINFVADQLITSIPITREKVTSTIISKRRTVDKVLNGVVIEFVAVNDRTAEEEFYILLEKPEGAGYELYQEIKDTDMRLFFNKDARCVH